MPPRKAPMAKKVKLGLFLREQPATPATPATESSNLLPGRTPELVRLNGERTGVVVAALEDGTVRTRFLKIYLPFIDKGRDGSFQVIRPARITTTGVFHARCQWCGDFICSAGDLIKRAGQKKDYSRKDGVRGAMRLLSRCPDCGKPYQDGWKEVTPSDPEASAVFPPEWVSECLERTRCAKGAFELPALVGAYPLSDGYVNRSPFTQRGLFDTAASTASKTCVRLKNGRTVQGLALVDVEQLPQPPTRPIAWFLLFGTNGGLVGEADYSAVDSGWRSGVNLKWDLRVFLQTREPGGRKGGGYSAPDGWLEI